MKYIVGLFLLLIAVLLVQGLLSCQVQRYQVLHRTPRTLEQAQRQVQRQSTPDQQNRRYYPIPAEYQVIK